LKSRNQNLAGIKQKSRLREPAFLYSQKDYFLVGFAGADFGLAAAVSVFLAGAAAFFVTVVAIV
jgi:hypothetical protein